ncbi:MAG: outer membrane protein assembly factor BamD [Rickettsiales bacterium]
MFLLHRLLLSLLLLSSLTFLSACSSDDEDEENDPVEAADVLYNKARKTFDEQDYKEAIKQFDEVERVHPYSEWAPRSQIMSAYASYRSRKYDDAILTLERFVKLHPGNESAPYAYYMIAQCYYEQISDVGRDQGMTEKALKSLRDVIKRFPNTEYARDSKLKLDLTIDHLAGKEMMVGMYYLERKEYISAATRFKNVIDKYQTTSHTPEALHRLVETYMLLGVETEAKRYAAVLGHNFPGSEWYRRSYALLENKQPPKEKGWMEKIF